jgi:signal transduction histidine kinase
MDRGLVAALDSAAGRASLPVDVVGAGELGRFPEDVEAAVYFCCLEALQNAAKHAGDGARATVTIGRSGDGTSLEFTVADDGVGFDGGGAAGRGHGFVNMSDRVGAIGGTLAVESSVGAGTRITGSIPVPPGAPAPGPPDE